MVEAASIRPAVLQIQKMILGPTPQEPDPKRAHGIEVQEGRAVEVALRAS